jgi:hypothetical protein
MNQLRMTDVPSLNLPFEPVLLGFHRDRRRASCVKREFRTRLERD